MSTCSARIKRKEPIYNGFLCGKEQERIRDISNDLYNALGVAGCLRYMAASVCRPVTNFSRCIICRGISTTPRLDLFWERDPKSGYGKEIKFNKNMVVDGFRMLKTEFSLFKKELIELWESDPVAMYQPGVTNKFWDFKSEKDLEQWTATSDSDHQEGFSKCSFEMGSNGHALFSGTLSTEVPKDGVIKRAGYCSVRSHRARKSFQRDAYHDWSNYTHLVIRCRGDGRTYMLNLYTTGYFDQLWNDVYNYPLYTRGGPYWQISRIPFSKFFFSSKGRIQDLQYQADLEKVSNFGFTAADRYDGSFRLEIDYVALHVDPSFSEEFAYENYRLPKGIAAN